MVARGYRLGSIQFHRIGGPGYGGDQLAVLEDLTGRAALALDNARLYAERAHVARTLRRSLIPSELPSLDDLELGSYFQPMTTGDEVSGDFFDVFVDPAACWLVVGDVCGKGAEAAALTGFLRHTAVAYAREGQLSPAEVLWRVNEAMLDHDFGGRFATAILVRLDGGGPELGVSLATAGHPPALLARAAGGAEELGSCGTLLGVFRDVTIPECTTVLRGGDTLVLYTDGLAEAHAPQRILPVETMLGSLAAEPPASPQEAIEVLTALAGLDRGARDDVAMLVARARRGVAG
jgi:serine phosphatase RsbU (regulator of sigma subunit)